jgi:diadenosine tetraphosphatase ApaH/serine/threonine PP2A family protein phosphatase
MLHEAGSEVFNTLPLEAKFPSGIDKSAVVWGGEGPDISYKLEREDTTHTVRHRILVDCSSTLGRRAVFDHALLFNSR